jgi:FMN phosphatase YigB (HAD superfamily)
LEYDVILFDWGGTLAQVVRQDELLRRGAAAAARAACVVSTDDAIQYLINRIVSLEKEAAGDPELREADLSDMLAGWGRSFDGQVRRDRLADALEAIGREWIGSLDPLPGAVETLQKLRGAGCRAGLVSNCMMPAVYCREELDRQGFGGLLDFAIFSSAVGYRKPSRRIYEAALAKAFPEGRPADLSRVLFVGDSPACDVVGPAGVGMKTALVRCYKGIWDEEDYRRARPDLRIDSVAELPGKLGIE